MIIINIIRKFANYFYLLKFTLNKESHKKRYLFNGSAIKKWGWG